MAPDEREIGQGAATGDLGATRSGSAQVHPGGNFRAWVAFRHRGHRVQRTAGKGFRAKRWRRASFPNRFAAMAGRSPERWLGYGPTDAGGTVDQIAANVLHRTP